MNKEENRSLALKTIDIEEKLSPDSENCSSIEQTC